MKKNGGEKRIKGEEKKGHSGGPYHVAGATRIRFQRVASDARHLEPHLTLPPAPDPPLPRARRRRRGPCAGSAV
jgi:hypothetical protein